MLAAMLQTIVHRGPDDSGTYLDGAIALGMRRLSIIDLETGQQPIANEDGNVRIVFNGEIYNFRQLRSELESSGHVFRTRTDTEVIVHSYEEWGDDCVNRLNGIFAFAIWDRTRQRLLLARDHFGVKPLYYSWDGCRLLFGSEIKALRPWGVPTEVDIEGLDLALALGYVPSPLTLFRGVRKLRPGHCLVLSAAGGPTLEERRYWNELPTVLQGASEEEIVEGLKQRIERAVERQMMSDVPVGALLSGGVDSTAVVTLMRRLSDNVRTFSIGIKDAPAINELAAARKTARRLGTQHSEIEIGASEYVRFLPMAYEFLEEPSTPSSLLTFFVCKLARESVKVVLTGQGADEIFAGYPRYLGERYGAIYRRMPSSLTHTFLPVVAERLRAPLRIRRGIEALSEPRPVRRFRRIHEVFSESERGRLLSADARSGLRDEERFDPFVAWSAGLESMSPFKQLLYIDARTSLSDNLLLFGDKMSMATSVEARVPFLDLELARFAESIPGDLHVRRGKLKYILRRALDGWVPDEILRGKKLGFPIPEDWFRGPLHDFLADVLGDQAILSRYISRERFDDLLAIHRSGARNLWRHLFTLLSIELSCAAVLRNRRPVVL